MKCPKCKGYGYYEKEEDGIIELIKCECQYTNEEWLRSASTEQLAKVLLSFCQYPCEICKIQCDDGNACTYNKALNTIVEWLKQPHTKE